jgi:2-polyprenyl-3-methyl-5-hydroxy-6-metoxy-1,4-benzoquinol methylase
LALRTKLDQRWYPGHRRRWDSQVLREHILAHLSCDMRLLDLGAGRGANSFMNFKGFAKEVVGADVDPAVIDNPLLDRPVHTPNGDLSVLASNSFDVIVSNDVLEHVEAPHQFFAEVARLLVPGGRFFAKTPNLRHYVPLVARLTPLSLHKNFMRARGRPEVDTFATFYRANTPGRIRSLAQDAGLQVESIFTAEGRPSYLRFNPVFYAVGTLYERTVNALSLDAFKAVIFARLAKPKQIP